MILGAGQVDMGRERVAQGKSAAAEIILSDTNHQ